MAEILSYEDKNQCNIYTLHAVCLLYRIFYRISFWKMFGKLYIISATLEQFENETRPKYKPKGTFASLSYEVSASLSESISHI